MHCTFSVVHGTAPQILLHPCTHCSVGSARNTTWRQRRSEYLKVYCAADVAASLQTSATVRLDHVAQVPSIQSRQQSVQAGTHEWSVVGCGAAVSLVAHKEHPTSSYDQEAAVPRQPGGTVSSIQQSGLEPQHARPLMTGHPSHKQQPHRNHKHSGRRRKKRNAQQQANSTELMTNRSKPKHLSATKSRRIKPVELLPCERGATQAQASTVSKLLLQGQHALLAVGSGMQVPRSLAALSSARSLMLSTSSAAGLVFQPVVQNHLAGVTGPTTAAAKAEQQQHSEHCQPTTKRSVAKSLSLFTCRVDESQLRRHEQNPLISPRYGSSSKLAAAAFARVCQQGYTAVRAAGPDAVRVALLAVSETRQKLLPYGLDIAVVPATEFVDVDRLPEQSEQQSNEYESGEYADQGLGGFEDSSRQFVQVTVLHVVRCQLGKPWKLLAQRVPYDELPATLWQQRQQKAQQQCQQEIDTRSPVVLETALQLESITLQQPTSQVVGQDTLASQQTQQQQQQWQQAQWQQQQHYQRTPLFQSLQQQPHQSSTEQADAEMQHAVAAAGASAGVSIAVGCDDCVESVAGYGWPSLYSATPVSRQDSAVAAAMPSAYSDASQSMSSSSGSSIDGSIWCQHDDPEYAAIHVGEGTAFAEDDVQVLWLQGTSAAHNCSSKHPSQLLLMQKQRREKSSKRQLVAAAQRGGQGDAGASSCK